MTTNGSDETTEPTATRPQRNKDDNPNNSSKGERTQGETGQHVITKFMTPYS
eukprot:CAMPEP_0172327804 /NCGR_PEP_ID=MMETSP1058-20130122/60017_1 /TAXON_ID=83371 /ORGANISM="Detonula confervacea, Strain CCMP 353" /LENGTH=51 /DNA_ID=CAMNT_0013044889 /DNA_START=47 /DNA_END=202 /DNA_ORIENTATION=-